MTKSKTYKEIKQLVAADFDKMEEFISSSICEISNESQELAKELEKYLTGSSKQLRACLIFLFSRMLYGQVTDNAVKLAAAVEIIHNATLIHDDIIDNADFRRGEIALHKKYGTNLAVIAGDFLLALAINLLNSIKKQDIISNFSDCLINLCKGEICQYFSQKQTPTIEDYIKKSQYKTASLFVAALKSLTEINDKQNIHVTNFAKHFGIAFQIKDDLNNFTSEKDQKPLYLDLEQGIYTAPVIFAYGENKDLTNISTEQIIETASQDFAIEKTKELLNIELGKATESLHLIQNNLYKDTITELCNFVNIS